jgi:SAM-dependent methyltransferase
MICHICQSSRVTKVGYLPWHSELKKEYTDILKCRNCGTYFRPIRFADTEQIKNHFKIAPYARLSNEGEWRNIREKYFDYLIGLLLEIKTINGQSRILDIGCSFGHLLQKMSKFNADCFGIEIIDSIREFLRRNNPQFRIYESIEKIPEDYKFDIVTMVDILYYLDDPLNYLIEVKRVLKDEGIALIRITNRSWLLDILNAFHFGIKYKHFSDAKYVFSDQSMKLLLEKVGFRILRSFSKERGRRIIKSQSNRYLTKLTSLVGPIVSNCIRRPITPGLIYIVQGERCSEFEEMSLRSRQIDWKLRTKEGYHN